MLQVKRAGHSTITTPDVERAVDYFTGLLGLSLVAREKNRIVLATKSGVESVVLERGDTVEVPRLSFQIAPGSDLDEVASRVKKAGLKSERRSDITPGIGSALTFQDPKGTTLEIFSDFEFAGPDNTFTGVMPLKFGHIAYQCPDVQGVVKFYCDMLGFKVSDWRGDFFAFLRCSRDHHTVNFLRDPKTSIHHIAFEVRDWSEIKRASDMLAQSGIKLAWGPLRHIIGHNIAIYHKNPDGVTIELFCEIDQMHDEDLGFFEPRPWHQDRPQRPKVWGDGTLSNWWGPMSHNPGREPQISSTATHTQAPGWAAGSKPPATAKPVTAMARGPKAQTRKSPSPKKRPQTKKPRR
jgi:catechol 2,3-dioxygenase-like lactoylglutathione lyase family enzyme